MGTPLTEERFLEFVKVFDTRMTGLEGKVSSLDGKVTGLEGKMTELESTVTKLSKTVTEISGFQLHESKAIEFELSMILRKHLGAKYPLFTVSTFPLKRLYDPQSGKEITELDAAFIVQPIRVKPDRELFHKGSIDLKYAKVVEGHGTTKFILAEAKHHMTRENVLTKLNQFERIRQMFASAKHLVSLGPMNIKNVSSVTIQPTDTPMVEPTMSVSNTKKHPYTADFVKVVTNNPVLANIGESMLYFGAAYWDHGLLDELQADVEKYKKHEFAYMFENPSDRKKLEILNGVHKLEKKWGLTLSTNDDDTIDGALKYVDFIVPSGDRFIIPVAQKGPEPIAAHIGGTTRKTFKRKRGFSARRKEKLNDIRPRDE